MTLVVASRNRGKLIEIAELLRGTGWQTKALDEIAPDLVLREPGLSFVENARHKARDAFAEVRTWVLAEDSGLEVDALGGEPGVMSARYCGPDASDWERNRVLLERIIAVPDDERTARFRCAACLIDPAGTEILFEGICSGRVSHQQRGRAGFGYDPIFIPDGFGLTFAELGRETKNRISHRAKVLHQVADYLRLRSQPRAAGLCDPTAGPLRWPGV